MPRELSSDLLPRGQSLVPVLWGLGWEREMEGGWAKTESLPKPVFSALSSAQNKAPVPALREKGRCPALWSLGGVWRTHGLPGLPISTSPLTSCSSQGCDQHLSAPRTLPWNWSLSEFLSHWFRISLPGGCLRPVTTCPFPATPPPA